jgi:TDG/mug DNA glycosylase family protein
VLFSGINPGLYSAATGYHFARPGNRFWPALHQSGFTDRQLAPQEQEQLLALGLGITNVVARATARADELDAGELLEGGKILAAKQTRLKEPPTSFGGTRVWVLPNPSGLNAHWSADALAGEFAWLRAAAS